MENKIKNMLVVGSVKGGVGKSVTSCLFSLELYSRNIKTGIIDIDISGPSLPKILGVKSMLRATDNGIQPVLTIDKMPVISVELFMNNKATAVLWDSDKKRDYIQTILNDTDWNLDYLIVDSPPSTGAELQSIIDYIHDNNINAGMVMISSPQLVSLNDVQKGVSMARRLGLPIIGLIENFSMFKCVCGREHYPFGSGKVEAFCKQNNIKYLGTLPISPELSNVCDTGLNISNIPPEIKVRVKSIVDEILKELR